MLPFTMHAQTAFDAGTLINSSTFAYGVHAADMDGDGDQDVVGAGIWHANLGNGSFGPEQLIAPLYGPELCLADLDGDGDVDLIGGSASSAERNVYWIENLDGGFAAPAVIASDEWVTKAVSAVDLDGDGDLDVLSTSSGYGTDRTVWWENLGGASFSGTQYIDAWNHAVVDHAVSDVDGDGDLDVFIANQAEDQIAWVENLGGGSFGPRQLIFSGADFVQSIEAADLDGDGDEDLISASGNDDRIAWYENTGGSFGPQQIISSTANLARDCALADLDNDGDIDVLSASEYDDKVAWYENMGDGSFGPQQIIDPSANGAYCVTTADLDGDGDLDVLSSSINDNSLRWYENLMGACSDAPIGLVHTVDSVDIVSVAWKANPEATYYQIKTSPSPDASWRFRASKENEKRIAHGFDPERIYAWKVRAICPLDTSPWSTTAFFQPGTATCSAPPSELVAWWKAEGNTADAIGSNNGFATGDLLYKPGRVGGAFALDGLDDAIRIPATSSLYPATGSFSVEAWIHLESDGNNFIFGQWGDTGPWSGKRAFNLQVWPDRRLFFAISDLANQNNAGLHQFQSPPGTVPLDRWTHVAAVYDQSSGTRLLYRNGELVASRSDPPLTLTNSIADFSIGSQASSPTLNDFFFDGRIDEVSFYHRALSASEIRSIFRSGRFGKCVPLPRSAAAVFAGSVPETGEKDIWLFPNPASGYVNLQLPSEQLPAQVSWMDALGRILRTESLSAEHACLELTGLPRGICVLRIQGAETTSAHLLHIE
jgi:hypothetical protein